MSVYLLDNPGWHALNSHHRHLAVWGEFAARYQPDIFFAGAMPENSTAALKELRNLVEIGEAIGVVGPLP